MVDRRLLLAAGIIAPVAYALGDLVAGTFTFPGYSFRDQTISELGAIGAPSRPVFSAFILVSYAALTAYGVGIWKSAEGDRRMKAAGAFLVALGITALTVGQFVAMRPRGAEQGLQGAAHLIEGAAAMLLLLAAMGFAAAAMDTRFRLYTLATIAVVVVFGGWSSTSVPAVEAGLVTPWVGVIERVFWYSYQVWYAVLAVVLMRREVGRPETV